jgi:signal transduction histidine kinase
MCRVRRAAEIGPVSDRSGASRTPAVLLRILREVVLNAMQHGHGDVRAKPTSVDGLRLRVSDDGDGFYRDADHRISGGLGLTTSDERSQFLTAELYVGSSPGQEAELEVVL